MSDRRLLVVCPDYASHYYPLSGVAEACRLRGIRVAVATGAGMEGMVRRSGFGYERLVLGPGRNTGLMRPEEQGQEAEHMRAFYEATRRGPAATLLYQSAARQHDMLHAPKLVYQDLLAIVERQQPDLVLVDQLSYAATLALHALGTPFASFHPGHPAAIPGPGELFGLPAEFPPPLHVDTQDLTGLQHLCRQTTESFTAEFNVLLGQIAPGASQVPNAFAFTSPSLVLLNYPHLLARERQVPRNAHFLGSCLRTEQPDARVVVRLDSLPSERPLVYVSFGTFLSAREDALARVVQALRTLPVNVVLAAGTADTTVWEPLPPGWIVRSVLPQLEVLRRAALAVTHGGNNSVTESLTFGVPLLVGPFSSDQFDTARDVLEGGMGEVFDANRTRPECLAEQINRILHDHTMRDRVAALGRSLRAHTGPDRAAALLASCIDQIRRS